jgi:hypothetical protein
MEGREKTIKSNIQELEREHERVRKRTRKSLTQALEREHARSRCREDPRARERT